MDIEQLLDRLLAPRPEAPRDAILASHLVFRVSSLLEGQIDAVLDPFGLRMQQYLALALLSGEKNGLLTPSELSATLDATRTQTTRLLDGLEKLDLVRRRHSTTDRRSLGLVLTESGQAVVERVRPLVHRAHVQAWSALGAQDLAALTAMLHAVNARRLESDT